MPACAEPPRMSKGHCRSPFSWEPLHLPITHAVSAVFGVGVSLADGAFSKFKSVLQSSMACIVVCLCPFDQGGDIWVDVQELLRPDSWHLGDPQASRQSFKGPQGIGA